jgi:hypothetical protein
MQRPLLDLESGIQRIHSGDLEFRPRKAAADEIGSVVDAFNGLLDQQQVMSDDLAAKNRLFEIISRLQKQFISEPEPGVMFDKLLQNVISLTKSEFGLLGEGCQRGGAITSVTPAAPSTGKQRPGIACRMQAPPSTIPSAA